jgi:hypothetical protein
MTIVFPEKRPTIGDYVFVAVAAVVAVALLFAYLHFTREDPRPPIAPLVRPSHTGIGYVLMIHNASDDPLGQIALFVTDPADGSRMSYTIPVIAANKMVEVGWLEAGWAFQPRHTLAIEVEGYERLEGTIEEILQVQGKWLDSKFEIKSGQ